MALFGVAAIGTLMWPGPAGADTTLGGYSGLSQAQPVRIQIYEPVIPIPATPQVDGGIAYTRSNTDTGPVSRALASYLWPGDTVGDGFGTLTGNDTTKYPVQVNSRFPATKDSPAKNTGQLTDGNGMTTSSDGFTTKARVTGFGVTGTNSLSNPGAGLGDVLSGKPPGTMTTPTTPDLPVPTSTVFSTIVSVGNVTSDSTVTVGNKTFTATAQAAVSQLKLLAGLITVGGVDMTATTISDGKKATTTGSSTLGNVTIAGMDLGLDEKGVALGGSSYKTPVIPKPVTEALKTLGIEVTTLKSARTVDGASSSLKATGMVISIDTAPLKNALNLGGLLGPLQDVIAKIPQLGSQLAPVLGIGPKIVLTLGSVESAATAAPAYDAGPVAAAGGQTTTVSSGNGSTGGTAPVLGAGGGATGGGNISAGDSGAAPADTGTPAAVAAQPVAAPVSDAGYNLPGLGAVPKFLILVGLGLAAGLGYLLRTGGVFLLGAGDDCAYGLETGVPDMRSA
ncbi:MAG: choice-of-anchor P family protein [Jatrophihabitans sp.]